MDSVRSTGVAAVTLLVALPFAITAVGDSFGAVPDPVPPPATQPAPAPLRAAPAPFGVPQTSIVPASTPAGAQIPGDR